jgi:hypothetical protein
MHVTGIQQASLPSSHPPCIDNFVIFKSYWLGHMPNVLKNSKLNQYINKNHIFRWSLSTYILWLWVCGKIPIDYINCLHTQILKNNAQELRPYRFEFKCAKSRIRTYFLSLLKIELGSLGWKTDVLANLPCPSLTSLDVYLPINTFCS